MDKERAKEILLLRRRWAPSRSSEETTAVELSEKDPELAAFAQQNEEFNARVHHELANIPVPDVPKGLRDQVLARGIVLPVPFWKKPELLAIAASLLVLGTALLFWMGSREETTYAGFRSRMVGFALREYRMDLFTQSLPQLKEFLAARGGPSEFSLPAPLANTPLKGGARLSWQNVPVSMVCFDWQGKETIYMFVIDGTHASPAKFSSEPRLFRVKGLTTATWIADGKTFLLAAKIPQNVLSDLVKSG